MPDAARHAPCVTNLVTLPPGDARPKREARLQPSRADSGADLPASRTDCPVRERCLNALGMAEYGIGSGLTGEAAGNLFTLSDGCRVIFVAVGGRFPGRADSDDRLGMPGSGSVLVGRWINGKPATSPAPAQRGFRSFCPAGGSPVIASRRMQMGVIGMVAERLVQCSRMGMADGQGGRRPPCHGP